MLEHYDRDPLVGSIVAEHYQIDALIGEGGMGRVYRAHHVRLQHRQFAIKVLIGDLATTVEMRMRFAHEADAASRLDHPNVVPVVDFGCTAEGLMFLAMELVAGPTLAEVIAACGPIDPVRVIAIARQLCLGLAHAHECGLVHRDFKPDNVIVGLSDGVELPRIVDFGLAIDNDDLATRLTTAGVALGTPIYASPEQTHNEPVDRRADLFALGVTLYEMLAGTTPFDGGALEIMHQNATSQPPPLAVRGGAVVPIALEDLVRRLMSRRPADRFASATEVIAALDLVAAVDQIAIAAPPLPRRRRRWVIAAASALGITGILGVVVPREPAPVVPEIAFEPAPRPAKRLEQPVIPPASVASQPEPQIRAAPVRPRSSPPRARPAVRVEPAQTVVVEAVAHEPIAEPREPALASEPPPPTSLPPPVIRSIVDARATIGSLEIRGSLSSSIVRRAIERTESPLRSCYLTTARATNQRDAISVRVSFEIDDTRRATKVAVGSTWPQLTRCITGVFEGLRTQVSPDVGTVPVSLEVTFAPELR